MLLVGFLCQQKRLNMTSVAEENVSERPSEVICQRFTERLRLKTGNGTSLLFVVVSGHLFGREIDAEYDFMNEYRGCLNYVHLCGF